MNVSDDLSTGLAYGPSTSKAENQEESKELVNGNESAHNEAPAITLEVPQIVQNSSKTDPTPNKDTLAPGPHVTFDMLYDRISMAEQNDETKADMLSVNAHNDEPQFTRKRSFMKRVTTRRRTVRSSMNATHINRAAGYESKSGKNGHVLTAEEKLRMYTLKEIVNTEEEYVQLLQFVVEVIIPTLNKCAADIEIKCVSQDTVDKLLSNIEAIYKLHQKFIADLKEATYPFPYHNHCIGAVFLKHEKAFHVYEQYCANYSNAQKVSYELEEDEKIKQLVNGWKKEVESKTRKLIHLECFLISPVQRLCKYPLFLRELSKYTNDSHSDYNSVLEAKKMMELVATSVNEAERRKLVFEAIRDLENASDSWEKNGGMSKQGFMTKRSSWLKNWNIQWFILESYQLSQFHQPTDTKAITCLQLRTCKNLTEDATPYTGKPYSFGIGMTDKTHFVYCTSEQERQEWLTVLKWKLGCIERSRRQTEKPIQTAIIASLSSMMNPTEPGTPRKPTNNNSNRKTIEKIQATPTKLKKHRSKSLFGKSNRGKKIEVAA